MRLLINKLKDIGLSNRGIIYGGLVRSDIIGGHFRNEFFKKELDYTSYWNVDYDRETSKRTSIPNDMDIYFKENNNLNCFINDITKLLHKYDGYIDVKNYNNFRSTKYISKFDNLNHTKIFIRIRIGRTLNFGGFLLKFSIDALSLKQIDGIYVDKGYEPPFYNLDFLSNIFLMENASGANIVRISNCTGTPIDSMNYIDKAKITVKIMNDIINNRTSFVRNLESYNCESINCYRILKMVEYGWHIDNIPFRVVSGNEISSIDSSYKEDKCCICLELVLSEEQKDIDNHDNHDDKLIELNTYKTKSNFLHYDCFIKYLRKEQYKQSSSNDSQIECKCPYRNPFNFKDCYKLVSYDLE
jgi:hypothetical protein